jgi:hypothetical protein
VNGAEQVAQVACGSDAIAKLLPTDARPGNSSNAAIPTQLCHSAGASCDFRAVAAAYLPSLANEAASRT